jgi:hypothetical protein
MLLLILLASSIALGNKDGSSRFNRMEREIKIKNAVCVDEDTGEKLTGLVDTEDCPGTYIDFYKKLPSSTALADDLTAFQTECVATICAKEPCVTLVNAQSVTYNDAFKTSLKTNCIPNAAKTLSLDICRNGDDTLKTTLSDAEDCLASYDALIAALPVSDTTKKLNTSFLTGGETEFSAFLTKCAKPVCNNNDCYAKIVKKSTVTLNAALKATLNSKCDPHPPPAGDEGIFAKSANALLLTFGS